MNKSTNSSIIWCIDPMQDPRESKNLVLEMQTWSKRLACQIQPVSIFSENALNFPLKTAAVWEKQIEEAVRFSVDQYLKKSEVPNLLPAKIFSVSSLSNRRFAAEMANFAWQEKAVMICAQTGAHKTWNPFRLGGFAETLAATSKVPVLLMNASSKPSAENSTILFPTDLSDSSKTALHRVIPFAKAANQKVMVYHQTAMQIPYLIGFGQPLLVEIPNFDKIAIEIEKENLLRANALVETLRNAQVASAVVIQKENDGISEQILKFTDDNQVGLIALVSHSGPWAQAILGGTVQDVILQAKCPVLVFLQTDTEFI
ncbi:MAG: universal stress protein [Pseudobdellovibrionaceae bacterium]